MFETDAPNLARHVFLHPAARSVYPDWETAADEQVGRLRAASLRRSDDDGFTALMDELRTTPEFNARWSGFGTSEKRRGMKHLRHPHLGDLRLNYEELLLADEMDEQRLITWLPADDATHAALAVVAGPQSPAQLRIIG
jgi:hypothetical protein